MMNSFEERLNRIGNTEFTELRIKPLDKIHDSGYKCFEIIGYNHDTKEEMLISTVSDVIGFPCVHNPYDFEYCIYKMDWHPSNDYMRLFTVNPKYVFKATWILSDFQFEIIERGKR